MFEVPEGSFSDRWLVHCQRGPETSIIISPAERCVQCLSNRQTFTWPTLQRREPAAQLQPSCFRRPVGNWVEDNSRAKQSAGHFSLVPDYLPAITDDWSILPKTTGRRLGAAWGWQLFPGSAYQWRASVLYHWLLACFLGSSFVLCWQMKANCVNWSCFHIISFNRRSLLHGQTQPVDFSCCFGPRQGITLQCHEILVLSPWAINTDVWISVTYLQGRLQYSLSWIL